MFIAGRVVSVDAGVACVAGGLALSQPTKAKVTNPVISSVYFI